MQSKLSLIERVKILSPYRNKEGVKDFCKNDQCFKNRLSKNKKVVKFIQQDDGIPEVPKTTFQTTVRKTPREHVLHNDKNTTKTPRQKQKQKINE